jgi:hypothetical protein
VEEDNSRGRQLWRRATLEENNSGGQLWRRTTLEEDNSRIGQL